jgi:hypothetical protein
VTRGQMDFWTSVLLMVMLPIFVTLLWSWG